MKKTILKPCPFCGGKAVTIEIRYIWIDCLKCGASIPLKKTKAEAIKAWNRRAK